MAVSAVLLIYWRNSMKPQDKLAIENMRLDGITPAEIASRLHLSPNTVYSHIRRHPKLPNARTCLNCGKPVKQFDGHKARSTARTGAGWAGGIPIRMKLNAKHFIR